MTSSRTHRSPARRAVAACALTGAALLAVLSGGQAWADGAPAPAPAAPSVSRPAEPSAGTGAGGAGAQPSVAPRTATPTATPAAPGAPVVSPSAGVAAVPTATPAPQGGTGPQVRDVPKGAAQAGDGSGSTGSSGLMLAGGGTVAAVGAAALGFALLRRRSGARG
ncbi:hypothetical protein OH807_20905 [Kitasatospora sp. NBC_01560]|uniref:sortase-dependent protein n=1 Tax=Kitasatospora sp. NBC_01560 TaxID=2975965 RepID=UPI003868DFD0